MNIKIGEKIYEDANGICVSNNTLDIVLSLDKVKKSTVEKQVKGSDKKVTVFNDDGSYEEYSDFTKYGSVKVDEETNSLLITLVKEDYEEQPQLETLEEQITDIQLAIAELYELIGG